MFVYERQRDRETEKLEGRGGEEEMWQVSLNISQHTLHNIKIYS